MSHYLAVLVVRYDDPEPLHPLVLADRICAALAPFQEPAPSGWWDYWRIGGRWADAPLPGAVAPIVEARPLLAGFTPYTLVMGEAVVHRHDAPDRHDDLVRALLDRAPDHWLAVTIDYHR